MVHRLRRPPAPTIVFHAEGKEANMMDFLQELKDLEVQVKHTDWHGFTVVLPDQPDRIAEITSVAEKFGFVREG